MNREEEEELGKSTLGPHCYINPVPLLQAVRLGGWTDDKQQQEKKKKSLIEKSQPSLVVQVQSQKLQPAITVRRACRDRFETSHVTRYVASAHTLTPQPPSHIGLSRQAAEIPRCGPTVSSSLPTVYFTDPAFVLLAAESWCTSGMGERWVRWQR